MVTFIILTIVLLVALVIAAVALLMGAAGFLVTFGDIIVCVALIALLARFLIKKRKGSK